MLCNLQVSLTPRFGAFDSSDLPRPRLGVRRRMFVIPRNSLATPRSTMEAPPSVWGLRSLPWKAGLLYAGKLFRNETCGQTVEPSATKNLGSVTWDRSAQKSANGVVHSDIDGVERTSSRSNDIRLACDVICFSFSRQPSYMKFKSLHVSNGMP